MSSLYSFHQTRKARYALFKVVNIPDQPLEIVLDKQADRKTSKEDFFKVRKELYKVMEIKCMKAMPQY